MSKKQLDLMFSQLVQDMEELTADLARDDNEKEQAVENYVNSSLNSSLKDDQKESSKLDPTLRQRNDSISHTYSTPTISSISSISSTPAISSISAIPAIPARSTKYSTSTTFTTSSPSKNNDSNSTTTLITPLSLIESSSNLKSIIPDKNYLTFSPSIPSSSSSTKVAESLNIQPSESNFLTNQVKSSVSPFETNSNSLSNKLKMNYSTSAKSIFDNSNNYDFDSTSCSDIIDTDSDSDSDSDDLSDDDSNESGGESLYKIVKSITSNDKGISPIIIPKVPIPSSNVSLETPKPKLYRAPTGRRPDKNQNLSQEIPVTPIISQKEKIFKPSEIKDVNSENFKQDDSESDDKPLNVIRSKSLRKKDNVPVERIRKDSKASEYISDDSKDRSTYARVDRIRKDSKASEYTSDDSKDRSAYTRVGRIRKDSKASEYISDDSKDKSAYARVERIRKDSKASEYISDDSKDRSTYARVERIRKDSKASEYMSDDTNERGRTRSKTNEYEDHGRAKSKAREIDDRGRTRSKTNDFEDRGRAKSRAREIDERGRAKSRARETDERDRAKSRVREVDERGRAKSKTHEIDERDRAKSRTREKIKHEKQDFEKDFSHISEVKIYVEHIRKHKQISLSPTMTALDVLNFFRNNDVIPNDDVWVLFEIANDLYIERPLRDWECISKVMGTWESEKTNSFTLKKYSHRNSLTLQAFENAVPPMFGWLHVEIKKNKWRKRYCQVKDGALYHSKDMKGTNEILLCSMVSFDVYTCTQMKRRQPTKFGFALKSQEKISLFENPEDYIHFLCADNSEKTNDWVLSIRAAKNNIIRQERPELFGVPDKISPQSSIDSSSPSVSQKTPSPIIAETPYTHQTGSSQWDNLRRHVRSPSKKTPQGSGEYSTDLTQTNSSVTSGPFKNGSLLSYDDKNPPLKPVEVEQVTFVKGSLLASNEVLFEQAKEREKMRRAMGGVGIIKDSSGNTFVQLDDTVKFNKGSLLSKNYNETIQSPTVNLTQTSPVRFNEGSLLAKSKDQSPIETSPTRSGLLVQIDEGVRYNKGSLLAKSKEQSPVETSPTRPGLLIHIDDGISYNKGSLLAKSREQSPIETSPTRSGLLVHIDEGVRYNKGSLLAKSKELSPIETSPTRSGLLIHIDEGVRSNKGKTTPTTTTTTTTTGRTLLEIDMKPDTKHTLTLRNANIQPLLSFVPGENQRNNNSKLRFDESDKDDSEETDYDSNENDSDDA
ncbi:serine/arginine-rich splicing factor 6 [Gigaspora margarita]|uniref:Serine/arginine-rich splicing factor 6 n=1 Tax=Gigaspora margarita TaxID=4874 RepID=A0A8H3X8X8_GIGMA|nr:serine/arginine-rich splicing factor 6 [Gigaspora margarita]